MHLFLKFKHLINKKIDKSKYFWKLKKINDFFFKKNSIYNSIQAIITNIPLRSFFAFLERTLFKYFFYNHYQLYFKKKIDIKNVEVEKINLDGISKPFKVKEFLDNKNKILEYFYKQEFFFDKEPNKKFNLKNKSDLKVGYFSNEVTLKCPHIFDIANNEYVLNTLSSYFKCPFKLDYISSWWSFKNSLHINEKTQHFHRDLDNFNFIKMFLYLSDVDENSGAHQYIIESHKKNYDLKISRSVIDSNKINEKNLKIFNFTGLCGTASLANTFGLHRGAKPIKDDRLMIVFTYSVKNSIHSFQIKNQNFDFLDFLKYGNYNKYINKNFIK